MYLKYGVKDKIKPSSIQKGTEIYITNIFNNVPARKKFLKSDSIEYRKVLNVFRNFLVSFPNIHFELFILRNVYFCIIFGFRGFQHPL